VSDKAVVNQAGKALSDVLDTYGGQSGNRNGMTRALAFESVFLDRDVLVCAELVEQELR
jgi:hypothetical protein